MSMTVNACVSVMRDQLLIMCVARMDTPIPATVIFTVKLVLPTNLLRSPTVEIVSSHVFLDSNSCLRHIGMWFGHRLLGCTLRQLAELAS